jgi:hypothetical protein
VVPPPEEQERIAALSISLSTVIQYAVKPHVKQRAVKTGLMRDRLTGKVRVKAE